MFTQLADIAIPANLPPSRQARKMDSAIRKVVGRSLAAMSDGAIWGETADGYLVLERLYFADAEGRFLTVTVDRRAPSRNCAKYPSGEAPGVGLADDGRGRQ